MTTQNAQNQNGIITAAVILLATAVVLPALAKEKEGYSVVGAGVRMHTEQPHFADRPFGKGDLSYGLNYQWQEEKAFLQLGLDYALSISAELTDEQGNPIEDSVNSILTPYLNLVVKDGLYRGGIGILRSMVDYDQQDDDWTPIYWQFLLGVNLPIVMAGIDIQAFYVFEGWDKLSDFKADDIEFGCSINFAF
ncbi:MAG: hypothetical protein QME60_07255 [Verrucomicrobiota bacterium]|nr:hypothetical protein [Verrucomicrobiota bacterium]